jgi:hypothetical protein
MKDDTETATDCAIPDPLAKLFDPSQYPKNAQLVIIMKSTNYEAVEVS